MSLKVHSICSSLAFSYLRTSPLSRLATTTRQTSFLPFYPSLNTSHFPHLYKPQHYPLSYPMHNYNTTPTHKSLNIIYLSSLINTSQSYTKTKMQYQQHHHMQDSSATSSWGYYVAVGPTTTMTTMRTTIEPLERVARLAAESAVVIFSVSSCCMCHAIKRLFCGLGVNPTVHELDQDPRGREMERALIRLMGTSPAVPVVFIGGKLVGSMDRVMGAHINGSLVPLLKEAGALWL